ncbi:hypothetical protein BAE44_0012866, partial [Dichanthelium oligosanthes]
LLARSNCGRKSKECTWLVASTFNVSMRIVQHIWDRAQKEKVVANLIAVADIPLNERSTIRSLAERIGLKKSMVHNRFKQG